MAGGGGATPAVPEFTRRQLDSLPDPVFAAGADGDIVYWGAAAERTFGWPRELAEGSSCALLLEGVDRGGGTVCTHPCPLAHGVAAGEGAGCGLGLGRVGWSPPAAQVTAPLHPDMAVARADGGRTDAVVLAFPAVLEGAPVLLHLLREATHPNRDGLTGVLTRDALARAVADEQHRAARSGLPLSLALVDVDQLKRINDRRGHEAGDRALVEVAEALRTGRREDLLGRWGGDEFVLLLPETGVDGARRHVEQALATLWAHPEGGRGGVSFSAGVVELTSAEPFEAALRRADTLLYRAKRRGRGRVVS